MTEKILQFLKAKRHHGINILWSNLSQAIISLTSILISVIFTRLSTKELYGQYIFVLSIFGFLSILSIPGVKTVIIKSIAQAKQGIYKIGSLYSLKMSLWAIPILIFLSIYYFATNQTNLGLTLFFACLTFPFFFSLQTWIPYLKGSGQFKKLSFFVFFQSILTLICILVPLLLTNNLVIITTSYLACYSLANILFYQVIKRKTKLNQKIDKNWKKQSLALTLLNLATLIFGKVDIIILGILLPIQQVAIYGLVMKMGDLFIKAIKSTVEGILPKIFKDSKLRISYFYKYFFLSLVLPLVLFFIIKYPIEILYGQEYAEVIDFSKIYMFALPFYFFTALSNNFLLKYNLNKEINIIKFICILTLVAMYFTLIPLWGILGGVIASVLYYVLNAGLNLYYLARQRKDLK